MPSGIILSIFATQATCAHNITNVLIMILKCSKDTGAKAIAEAFRFEPELFHCMCYLYIPTQMLMPSDMILIAILLLVVLLVLTFLLMH